MVNPLPVGRVARTEDSPAYHTRPRAAAEDDDLLARAREILERRWVRTNLMAFNAPSSVKDYCAVLLADEMEQHEVFAAMFLNAQHQLLASEKMFRGTLTQTSVYPREVVKRALHHNAAAVIFCHNHPSGHAEPSRADAHLTAALKQALSLVDVRVLDHIIVAGQSCVSFAERGLL